MQTAIAKSNIASKPKTSSASTKDATGQFTTPQKRDTNPIAAQKEGLSPKINPKRQPKVEPIKMSVQFRHP